MGANNWRVCPKCKKDREVRAEELSIEAAEAYGKVSVEEWKSLDAKAKECAQPLDSETLREDYEIGMQSDGEFFFDYGCSCSVCGFSHSKKVEEQVLT